MKKTTINIQNEANIKAEGKLNSGHCKPVICIDNGMVFTSITDAIEYADCHFTHMYRHLKGEARHVKGKHYCYLSRVNESLDAIVTRLRETAAVEAAAKKWMAYEAEQEAIRIAEAKRLEEERKAEEKRLEDERKAKEKHEADVAKAKDKIARRQAIRDRIAAQLAEAEQKLMKAEKELEALEDEGKEVA